MRKSSYIIQFVLLLGFMTVTNTVKAQWHKWQFGGGVGSLTYHGDLSDKFVNANLQELGYHAYVERLIAKRSGIYWRLESVNGYLLGSDRAPGGWINGTSSDFDRSLNFRTRIHDVNTSFVFYFGNRQKRDRAPFLNAYVRAGIGVGYFDVYGDLKDAGGNFYNYWSDRTIRDLPQNAPNSSEANVITRDYDFETNLRELEIEKSYNRFKWQIPVGLGLKMRLGDAVSLILDAQYTYAMTDYLDNVGDSRTRADITNANILRAADPAGYIGDRPRNLDKPVGVNDGYLYVSAGLTFNVGKNEKPKFKAPVYYPKTITPVEPDTVKIEEDIIEHPLDSIAKSLGQTIEKDTTRTTPFITLQKADSDSLFISLFQENHQQWLDKDSLTAGRTIDSVVLAKVPDMDDEYIARYYEKRISDNLLQKDTSILLKTDTLQLDLQRKAILLDSTYYTSSQTISNTSDDNVRNVSGDSLSFYIQQLRLQLDNLEKQIGKDSTKQNQTTSYSISETTIKSVAQKDSILSVEKKTDSTALKTSAKDSLNYSPANYSMAVRDTVKKDSLIKASVPKDSTVSSPKSAAKISMETTLQKSDTIKQVISDTLSQTTQKQKDSLQLNQLRQAEIKRQIEDLQKQLDENRDTIKPVIENRATEVDTSSKATIEDLKKRIAELENSTATKADTTTKTYKIASENFAFSVDSTKTQKDTVTVKNKAAADTSSNKRLDELKKKIVESDTSVNKKAAKNQENLKLKTDSIKTEKDTIKVNSTTAQDSSYNKTIDELKRKIDELENSTKKTDTTSSIVPSEIKKDSAKSTSNAKIATPTQKELKTEKDSVTVKNKEVADSSSNKRLEELKRRIVNADTASNKKTDSNNRVIDSSELSKSKGDSVKVEKDTLNGNSNNTSYNKTIEDLKKRISELENTPKQADTLKTIKSDTTSTIIPSEIKKDSVKNTNNARVATQASQKENNPENEELKNKIAELEQQIALQKGKEDSLKSVQSAPPSSAKTATTSNPQQDELLRRITDLENQLKTTQNAANNQNNTPSANNYYQARIDSLNNALAYQKFIGGYNTQPSQPYHDNRPAINPVIQPVVSIPIGGGGGKERREEKRAKKEAEKQRQLENQSQSELENDTESTSETSSVKTTKLSLGSTKDKGPGYFEAKRLKKEETSSSENNEVVADTSEISSDSLQVAIVDSNNVIPEAPSVDSSLQAENLWLKDQIKDIQKNQDSLLSILSNLLTKVAEPVVQPEPVVIEKEVKPQIDSAQILNGILSQPTTKVFFAVGKSALGNQYKTSLDQLANQMRNHPELKLELKGFADPTGNAAANMLLSEKRAQSVKNYLLQVHSISPEKITVLPVGQEDNSSDLSYSRRVEVKLVR